MDKETLEYRQKLIKVLTEKRDEGVQKLEEMNMLDKGYADLVMNILNTEATIKNEQDKTKFDEEQEKIKDEKTKEKLEKLQKKEEK